ncbi:MAG: HEAT repeat domain-containing protein [Phycisphaerae bacterium]
MNGLTRTLLAAGVVLATLTSASAQTAEPSIDLQVRVSGTVGALCDSLAGDTPDSEEAADSLVNLHKALLEPLREHADDADPEVRLRAMQTLSDAVLRTRILRVLAHVPQENEIKLRRFRQAHPQLFEDVFCDDLNRRSQAVARIATIEDPDALAEPLLVMCLGHPSKEMRTAAAMAATTGQYRSDALVEKLVEMVKTQGFEARHVYRYDDSEASAGTLAVTALKEIGSPAAAPALVEMLSGRSRGYYYAMEVEIAETLAATGELGAIPHLMELLEATQIYGSMDTGEIRITRARCDGPLLALVYLTGQDPSRYGFVLVEQYWQTMFGFTDAEDRAKAIERFRNWWDEHKDQPPYADIVPIELDRQPGSTGGPRRPTTAPAVAATTVPASLPAVDVDAEQVREQLEDLAAEVVRQWRDERFENRHLAGQKLLTTVEMILEPIVTRARDENARQAALEVLSRMVVEADAQSFLAELAAKGRSEQLEKALEFRRQHEKLFLELFSLNWYERAQALERIARLTDTERLAEPLLVKNLNHSSDQVVRAAMMTCESGRYDSEELVEELIRIALETEEGDNYDWWSPSDMPTPVAAVQALRRIGARRSAPALMALLNRQISNHRHAFAVEIVHALGATGEVNLLPLLAENLDKTDTYTTQSTSTGDGKQFRLTIAQADFYLMTALLLTDQDPEEYGFLTWPHHSSYQEPEFGFADEQKREEAVRKFRNWLREHSDEPPYDNLTPPAIPTLPQQAPSGISPSSLPERIVR